MNRIEVVDCFGCPFSTGRLPEHCSAFELADGTEMRRIPAMFARPSVRPPRWCPLRAADHLVTLRVK